MARIDKNDLTPGLRGKFGDQFLFRKTTIALRRFEASGVTTEAQRQQREKFRLATLYAKRCMLTPELKAEYDKIGRTYGNGAFAAAVTDFLKSITVDAILTNSYSGQAGFPLTVMVNDIHKMKTMKVTLESASGQVIEEGNAAFMPGSSGYCYVTTVDIANVDGLKLSSAFFEVFAGMRHAMQHRYSIAMLELVIGGITVGLQVAFIVFQHSRWTFLVSTTLLFGIRTIQDCWSHHNRPTSIPDGYSHSFRFLAPSCRSHQLGGKGWPRFFFSKKGHMTVAQD